MFQAMSTEDPLRVYVDRSAAIALVQISEVLELRALQPNFGIPGAVVERGIVQFIEEIQDGVALSRIVVTSPVEV
jgi:hypothetical protein